MKRLLLVSLLVAVCGGLWGNSIFSLYGMPEHYFQYDVYGMGAGDTGWADVFRLNLTHGNPAMAITSNNVSFSGATTFGYMTYYDKEGHSFRDDGLNFPYASFTLPIRRLRIGLDFASIYSGNVENAHQRTFQQGGQTYSVTEENRIQGNIYKASMLLAYRNGICQVGVSVNGYIGQHVHNIEQDFSDSAMMDTQYETARFYQGTGFTLGLAKRWGTFAAALSYSTKAKLEGDVEFNSIFDSEELGTGTYELPAHAALGVAWRFKEVWKTTFDAHYETWEDTSTYADGVNTWKLGLGFSYDPLWGYGSWYERIPWRVGVSHRLLPFKVSGSDVTETKLTCGISAPLKNPGDQIQFAVQYIMRGNQDNNGIEDNTLLFCIGATGFDIFKARTRRTAPRDIPMPDRY